MIGSDGSGFRPHEQRSEDHAGHRQADHERRCPREGCATQAGEQHQRCGRRRDQRRSQVVDDPMDVAERSGQGDGGHHQGDGTDGHVDVEDPPPAEVVDEKAPDQWTEQRGHPEHGHEEAHVATSLPWRYHIAEDGHRPDHQAPAPQPLQGAERDQLEHRMAQAGECRADQEEDYGALIEDLPPVEVAELAPQWSRDRRCQQVGGDHPGQVRGAMQIAHDGGQRGGHHVLVEGGQEHAQQQRTDDHQHPAVGERAGRFGWYRYGRLAHRINALGSG